MVIVYYRARFTQRSVRDGDGIIAGLPKIFTALEAMADNKGPDPFCCGDAPPLPMLAANDGRAAI